VTCPNQSRKLILFSGIAACLLFASANSYSQQTLGSVVGHIHVVRGGSPPERILVALELRGAQIDSVYTDSSGTFGFHSLNPNPYYVVINDDNYDAVRRSFAIDPLMLSPIIFMDITLIPNKKKPSDKPSQPVGSNPDMIDAREYSAQFPKHAVKEFEKGLAADRERKLDDAIRHYQKAVSMAPSFYAAHNNLGSDYLSRSDLLAARKEFEEVVRLNQSDADAYFNLSNVYMLSNQLAEAQQFLDEGLRRQPDSALAQFLLGSLNLRLGKFPLAENALRRAIQLDALMVQARLQLVNLLLKQGRKEDAASVLREFVSTFPDSSFSPQAKQLLQRLASSSLSAPVPN
jgi:tetratricopeptide (TPR) repeat protein